MHVTFYDINTEPVEDCVNTCLLKVVYADAVNSSLGQFRNMFDAVIPISITYSARERSEYQNDAWPGHKRRSGNNINAGMNTIAKVMYSVYNFFAALP